MLTIGALAAATASAQPAEGQTPFIGKQQPSLTSDRMTPEALWAMGRIATATASPDGSRIVYQVGYYSVKPTCANNPISIEHCSLI